MKKRIALKLTEESVTLWKTCMLAYLENLYGKPLKELASFLMGPGVLTPRHRLKGYMLQEAESLVSEAHYLKKGLAKLYSIDEESGAEKIFYIWEENSVIVMFKEFKEHLLSTRYYIELMEDAELVSIGNFSVDRIYEQHQAVHIIIQKILGMKTDRRMMQMDILTMVDKKRRYDAFKKQFPGLKGRLSNSEICGFIGITDTTLKEAKKIYQDNPAAIYH